MIPITRFTGKGEKPFLDAVVVKQNKLLPEMKPPPQEVLKVQREAVSKHSCVAVEHV